MFDDKSLAACLAHGADTRRHVHIVGQRGIEELHEASPDILAHPYVEDVAHELSESRGRDRPRSRFGPLGCGRHDVGAGGALLHDDMFRYGQELYEVGYGPQESVDLGPASYGAGVDGSKDVVLDTMSAHHVDRLHDAVEGTLAAAVAAEGVMYVLRAVERDPYEEVVRAEEVAPPFVDQSAVCLQRIDDAFACGVSLLQLHGAHEPVVSRYQRLAPVPDEGDRIGIRSLDILLYVALQQVEIHARLASAVYGGLVEVVAVGAVEVAGRACGLDHRAEDTAGVSRGLAEGDVFSVQGHRHHFWTARPKLNSSDGVRAVSIISFMRAVMSGFSAATLRSSWMSSARL